jgi:hypothetical protein
MQRFPGQQLLRWFWDVDTSDVLTYDVFFLELILNSKSIE